MALYFRQLFFKFVFYYMLSFQMDLHFYASAQLNVDSCQK